MKAFTLTLFATVCISTLSLAQDIIGQVLDKKDNKIEFARILDENGKLLTVTDSIGMFRVDLTGKTGFEVAYSGFESRWIAKESIKNGRIKVILDVQYLQLEEITVNNEKYHSALDLNSVNIVDYRPFGDHILTLKKKKNTYYLGIDSIGVEGISVPFTIDRPRSLFEDCLGNVHVVCDHFVYQFYFEDTNLVIFQPMTIEDFETQLEPCRGWFAYGLVTENLSYHNQQYDLTFYERGTGNQKHIYHQIDEVSAEIASEEALRLGITEWYQIYGDSSEYDPLTLRRMVRTIHKGENPDANLQFMKDQQITDTVLPSVFRNTHNNSSWDKMMSTYQLYSYPVDVRTMQIGNYLAVVDFLMDSVTVFDNQGELFSSTSFKSEYDIKEVWQDLSTGELYLFANHSGVNELFQLDIFTGETTYIKNLNSIPLSKDRKINDGWLYFKKLVNGYYKVFRMRLPV